MTKIPTSVAEKEKKNTHYKHKHNVAIALNRVQNNRNPIVRDAHTELLQQTKENRCIPILISHGLYSKLTARKDVRKISVKQLIRAQVRHFRH